MSVAQQGEAFVPESIVRLGTRPKGRDGVCTLKTKDDRIKWVLFVSIISTVNIIFSFFLAVDKILFVLVPSNRLVDYFSCQI